ncbi:hypothetical protein SASPL_147270 [Salvia splendens]|uniref:Thioredoxin domain-containing protein n=1 Tax=Salvia splendens TaxID=180675 RepID=A0A8X8WE56_SALSN|nr:hypothetical protein SASPL_147270 [Salvia splendens]
MNAKVDGLNYEFDEPSEFADTMETDKEVSERFSSASDEGGDGLVDFGNSLNFFLHCYVDVKAGEMLNDDKIKEAGLPSVRQIATVREIAVTLNVVRNLTRRPVRFPKPLVKMKVTAQYDEEMSGEGNVQWASAKAGENRIHVLVLEELGWLFNGYYDAFGVDKICEEESGELKEMRHGEPESGKTYGKKGMGRRGFVVTGERNREQKAAASVLTKWVSATEGIKLADDASKFLSVKITRAVAEVLAYLNDSQRIATKDVSSLAYGFERTFTAKDVQVPKQDKKDNSDILILETGILLGKKYGGRRKEDPLLGDISCDRCSCIDESVKQLEQLASLVKLIILKLGNFTLSHKEAPVSDRVWDIRYAYPMQEKDTAWFVKFCVPWCKHCKNLGTLWEDLGKEMEGEDEIEIGEVDCGTDKPVCSKVDIHSYPTFKLFYNGEEVAKYQGVCSIIACTRLTFAKLNVTGTRNVELLKRFALEETLQAATKAQLSDDAEL